MAFQGLYSLKVGKIPLEEVLKFDWTVPFDSEIDPSEKEADDEKDENPSENVVFARMLVSGTVEHLKEIDGIIEKHLKSWDISRINRVTLSILRMSVYELKYQTNISSSIVIDEAIHISKDYGPDDSFKFVNAILDNIKKFLKNSE